jgi:outer membrane protein OmpA-like peptidoglycan-associated protein
MSRLFLVLLLALVACKPKVPPNVDTDPPDRRPTVEDTLQVTALEPGYASAGLVLSAEVLGSGFAAGARAAVAGQSVTTERVDENTLRVQIPGLQEGSYDLTVSLPDGQTATLRRALTVAAAAPRADTCPPLTVGFGFDSSAIEPGARGAIDAAIPCLRDRAIDVRVEGHCDSRGTTDYNLALGQRRADAVARYLVSQGVAGARVRAVSFGEERPIDRSGGPAADSANRRVEIFPGGGR